MRKLLLCCLLLAACGNKTELAAKDREIAALKTQVAERDKTISTTHQLAERALSNLAAIEAAHEHERGARATAQRRTVEQALKANVRIVEYVLGRHIVDDFGNPIDVDRTMRDLSAWARRYYGSDEAARRMLIELYGVDAGVAIYASRSATESHIRNAPAARPKIAASPRSKTDADIVDVRDIQ